ncbi:bifunctional solanapyrone synthase [Aspergillus udagawae]|uniref:Bifunctional solanapyrone synthase n=1 Tax=Aspergillus udagawae TaxID=91492 RepID=A0ABQ1BDG1_9EURO|nr:bifunctional solanapyrone synthase [Aspergillus udagawae]GFG13276.1 bifunctional solanapyrone synthase [Aspergillus udagawae]GFG23149.1 bifunctional solanapyrone synthase [Aspergillus udagawae]
MYAKALIASALLASSALGAASADAVAALNAQNRPACLLFHFTAEEVSYAVRQLNKYPNTQFALKSGGHNFNAGVSSTNGGVLISFNEKLSSVTHPASGESFEVGPGAGWGNVYEIAAKTNYVVVGGRLANIGVAGLTRRRAVILFGAIFLGNGAIVDAIAPLIPISAHDLGDNGQVWGGIGSYSADKRQEVFKAMSTFIRVYPDAKAAVIPTFTVGSPDAMGSNPTVYFFYDGSAPPTSAFSGLEDVEPILDTTATTTYVNLTNQAGEDNAYGLSMGPRMNTFPSMEPEKASRLLEAHFQLYQSRVRNISSRNIDIQMGRFTPQPLSVRIARASTDRGGNVLGLDPANGDRIWVENDLIWINPICNDACPAYLREIADQAMLNFTNSFEGEKPTNYHSAI